MAGHFLSSRSSHKLQTTHRLVHARVLERSSAAKQSSIMASWFTNRMTRITKPEFYELVLSWGIRCDDAWFHLNGCLVCRNFYVIPRSPSHYIRLWFVCGVLWVQLGYIVFTRPQIQSDTLSRTFRHHFFKIICPIRKKSVTFSAGQCRCETVLPIFKCGAC
jgi:hypothetical protein